MIQYLNPVVGRKCKKDTKYKLNVKKKSAYGIAYEIASDDYSYLLQTAFSIYIYASKKFVLNNFYPLKLLLFWIIIISNDRNYLVQTFLTNLFWIFYEYLCMNDIWIFRHHYQIYHHYYSGKISPEKSTKTFTKILWN